MADQPKIKVNAPPLNPETTMEVGERLMSIIPPNALPIQAFDVMYLALRLGLCLVVKDLPEINQQCSFCIEKQDFGL